MNHVILYKVQSFTWLSYQIRKNEGPQNFVFRYTTLGPVVPPLPDSQHVQCEQKRPLYRGLWNTIYILRAIRGLTGQKNK